MKNIAVLGLGAMGSRLAGNLLDAGYRVNVYNRTARHSLALEAKGAIPAASPREACMQADIVIGMVTDDEASRQLWTHAESGAIHGLRKGAVAVESSTLSPAWVRELSGAIGQRGAHFLDAPVLGSRPQAEAHQLVYLVGGEATALAEAREVLAANSAAIHHVGPAGAGATLKLAVNALFGIQVAALGEILAILGGAGMDIAQTVELLGGFPVTSPALKRIASLMATRSFTPNFPIHLVEKDFRYFVAMASKGLGNQSLSSLAHDIYIQAIQEGYGNDDIAGISQSINRTSHSD
ncbi:MAG: NAD(P)-dependent oxidoreductase [Burkholderiales bacterium]